MTRTLIFETHATSLDNEAGLASGHYDVALPPRGESEARGMGDRYRGVALAAVYASDLQRSYRTAEMAFAGRDVPILRDPRLRECDYGDLTRRSRTEVEGQRAAHVSIAFPRGESYEDVDRRVADFLNEIRAQPDAGSILIVGHRATQYAVEHLLRGVTLLQAVTAPWSWQAGWNYELVAE